MLRSLVGSEMCIRDRDMVERGPVHTLSQSWRIGRAVALSRSRKQDPVTAVAEVTHGRALIRGKVVRAESATTGGWDKGQVHVVSLDDSPVQSVRVEFQNEMLVAFDTSGLGEDGVAATGGTALAAVPDLIALVDSGSGIAYQTEDIVYGLRVTVLVIPAHPMLTRPEVMPVTGPSMFKYPEDFAECRVSGGPDVTVSVFDEYR
eukprot:TRINITY_DN20485_c0_g1_i2.p1 TRINITY_DN20485_c0_g1~~TRINITY_DN20485_c0_g1_i2.p1  ORF type:complete len:204 (+),score=50.81 TRINITY_DN20485_c0_g1_i2:176-787(+)